MIRKEWGSPFGKIQEFRPQEYVAACEYKKEIPIPVGKGEGYWKVDGWNNRSHVFDPSVNNDHYNTYEQIGTVHKLTQSVIQDWANNPTSYSVHLSWGAADSPQGLMPAGEGTNCTAYTIPPFIDRGALLHTGERTWYFLSENYQGDSIDDYTTVIKNGSN